MYIGLVGIHSFGVCRFAWLFGGCVWLTCIVCGTVGWRRFEVKTSAAVFKFKTAWGRFPGDCKFLWRRNGA